ncbi:MAG: hypothetical protein LC132_05290 [Burkholderiales bacterium]|nr:hypothetical protein [Burkholderiales bacterium]
MTEKYYPSRKSNLIYENWEDQLFRTAVLQNYEVSISGGNENSKVFASIAYTDENGSPHSIHETFHACECRTKCPNT